MMNKKINNRKPLFSQAAPKRHLSYFVILLASAAALGGAWYLQNVLDLAPCPLCIMQRYGFWAMGIFGLLGLLKGRLSPSMNFVAFITGLCASAVALYHNWLLLQPKAECAFDPVQNFVNKLPTAELWPDMFMATGMCGAKLPSYFNLSIPMWSLIGLACLTLLFLVRLVRK